MAENRFELQDRTVIVTGGTRGIGLAMVRGLLEMGAKVVACSRKRESIDSANEQLSEYLAQFHAMQVHVGSKDDLKRLVVEADQRFGEIRVLINNAGTNPYYGPIVESEEPAWDKTMDVNLKGPYQLSQLVAKAMIKHGKGGAIVNVASIAGLTATPLQGIYSVSKAGLIMLTKVMARELGANNIRVNCICPGVVRTKLSEVMWSNPEAEQSIAAMKSLGRIGTTDEVVGAAIYFASDASSFTTGAILNVDGGMLT